MRKAVVAALAAAFALAACSQSPAERTAQDAEKLMRDFRPPAKAELQPTLAPILRGLAVDNPALAARLPGIEAEEKRLLAEMTARIGKIGAAPVQPAPAPQAAQALRAPPSRIDPSGWLIPAAQAQVLDAIGSETAGLLSSLALTGIIGALADDLAKSPQASKELINLIGKDGEKITLKADVAKDGTVTSTIDSNVEVAVLGINANASASISTKSLCPDAEGRVDLTVRLRADGSTGRAKSDGGRYEAKVAIVVDEQAEIAGMQLDLNYDVASSGKGGGTRATGAVQLLSDNGKNFGLGEVSTSGSGDFAAAELNAMKKVMGLALGAGLTAKWHWQGGKCIKIDAASPGSVKPNTVSTIDVKTTQRHEQSSVRAGVKVTLEGGASVDPAGFGTPGQFTHTAVGEENKTMKLILRATSRRGADELTLVVTTKARGYAINGGGGQFRGSGTVCDLKKPFNVYGNANIDVAFVPDDEKGGSYSYTGSMPGVKLFGKGTYQVHYVKDEPFKITASGPGSASAMGRTFTRPGSEAYVLTPKDC